MLLRCGRAPLVPLRWREASDRTTRRRARNGSGLVGEGPDRHAVRVDDDGELVREIDALARGDESLHLHGLVPASGEQHGGVVDPGDVKASQAWVGL